MCSVTIWPAPSFIGGSHDVLAVAILALHALKSAVVAFGIFENGLESEVLAQWCMATLTLAPTMQIVEDCFAAGD